MEPSSSGQSDRSLTPSNHVFVRRESGLTLLTTYRFEAFDEPWKVRYNVPGKVWVVLWGLMDADRNLKKGLKIRDCGGKGI